MTVEFLPKKLFELQSCLFIPYLQFATALFFYLQRTRMVTFLTKQEIQVHAFRLFFGLPI